MNKKTHAQIMRLLAVYYDLDSADQREVEQHVRECPGCADRLAAYRTMDGELARLPDPRPDDRMREEFYLAVSAQERRANWFAGIGRWLVGLPALAGRAIEMAILALLIFGLAFSLRAWLLSPAPLPPVPPATLSPAVAFAPADTSLPGVASQELTQLTTDAGISGQGQAADWVSRDTRVTDSTQAFVELAPSTSSEGFSAPQIVLAQGGEDGIIYTVQANDTLWKLAEKYLGDGRRFNVIVEATHAKRAQDPSFALIDNPGRIVPGSKLWIPTAGMSLASVETPKPPVTVTKGAPGHIAFSFWNDHPARCTYEINIIDVPACLSSPQACQANRRIFTLNNVSEPALSSAGDRLAFRGWGEPPSEDSPYLDCAPPVKVRYLANTTLDGTGLRGTGGFWEDSHPDWSPDGQQILFDSGRNGDDIIRILLINADGSNERGLNIAGQQPAWAPDGQRFVYRGCDLSGNHCGLRLAYAAPVKSWEVGANLIGLVVEDAPAAHPDWSPVSDQIVYQSPQGGSWDLYVASATGLTSGTRRLTSDPGIEGLPAWSPDGQWVAYLSDAGGNWGIWIIRADGSERHLLFRFDGGIFTPKPVEPYGTRDWIDEQISWSR